MMVGYGNVLSGSRRSGWEDAYLDYENLKIPLACMEELHQHLIALEARMKQISVRDHNGEIGKGNLERLPLHIATNDDDAIHSPKSDAADICQNVQTQRVNFISTLRLEIEKVSLFALSRQGVLADAVGALIFNDVDVKQTEDKRHGHSLLQIIDHDYLVKRNGRSPSSDSNVNHQHQQLILNDEGHINFLHHRTSIFPVVMDSTDRSSSEQRSSFLKPRPLFQGLPYVTTDSATRRKDDSLLVDAHIYLGVELLHLVRYICVNAVGVRKILKKYNKILSGFHHSSAHVFDPVFFQALGSLHDMAVGGYDAHLHQLVNSRSITAITASLKFQFDRLEQQNITHCDSYTHAALVRYRGVLYCISELLNYSQVVINEPFNAFLSRKAMIVTGNTFGDLDAPTLQALEIMLNFDPDVLLDMDDHSIAAWAQRAMFDSNRTRKNSLDSTISGGRRDSFVSMEADYGLWWGGVDQISMVLNLVSVFLYTVNYYIVAPTANHYAILLGTDGAFGATLVGASSFAAIFSAFLYSLWSTRLTLKHALVFSSFCPCLGNLLYAKAISWKSMRLALIGRILVGLGSAEVINRQLISMCVSFHNMTRASALFVAASAMGMSVGPMLAAILDEVAGRDVEVDANLPIIGSVVFNHVTSPGFLMMFIWLVEFLLILFLFTEPLRINGMGYKGVEGGDEDEFTVTSSENGHDVMTESVPNEKTRLNKIANTESSLSSTNKQNYLESIFASCSEQLSKIGELIFRNPALPVTLLLFAYIELVDEVLISSCSMICHRYFLWHASSAGLLIASLGALVLPAHYVVERASRTFDERTIMKWSLIFICISLFAVLNYQGLLQDVEGIVDDIWEKVQASAADSQDDGVTEVIEMNHRHLGNVQKKIPYDWNAGVPAYLISLSAIFMGTIILEGVDTSLMSKVTSPALNDTFINTGLLATLVGTLGRVLGDSMITISALIDQDLFTDFVNDTFFPLIPMALVGIYCIRRHYKKLV